MKKKMKRFAKGILTLALTVTMIFGQFPSGLALVASAAPEIIDGGTMPEKERGGLENNSENASGNTTLTDISQADAAEVDDNQVDNSQVDNAQVDNAQKDSAQKDNAQTNTEENESETVDETNLSNTTSESKTDKPESNETVNSIGSGTIEALNSLKGTLLKTVVVPLLDKGGDEPAGGDESKGGDEPAEEGPTTIDCPTITPVEGASLIYGSIPEDLGTLFNVEGVDKEYVTVGYSLSNANVGGTVSARITCADGFCFGFDEAGNPITEEIKDNLLKVKAKEVQIESITVTANREYEKENKTINNSITYSYYNISPEEANEIGANGVAFELASPDAGENVDLVNIGTTLQYNENYSITNLEDALANRVTSNVIITPKSINVSFETKISKFSDGTANVDKEVIENAQFVTDDGNVSVVLDGNKLEDLNWTYASQVPGSEIDILGAEANQFIKISEDSSENVDNYEIGSFDLKGEILPKEVDEDIDLINNDTSKTEFKLSEEDTFTFSSSNIESLDQKKGYWFNKSIEDGKLVVNSSNIEFVTENYINPYDFTMQSGDENRFDNVYAIATQADSKKIYYGPINIKYRYDNVDPSVDINKIKRVKKEYKINKESLPFTDNVSGIYDGGLVVVSETDDPLNDETFDNWFKQKKDTVPTGNGTVFYLVKDNSGNKKYGSLGEYQDETYPTIEISTDGDGKQTTRVSGEVKQDANGRYSLPNLSFSVKFTDKEEKDSGIKTAYVYLLDGTQENPNVYKVEEYEDGNSESSSVVQKGQANVEKSINYTPEDGFGYELHLLFVATDFGNNITYRTGYASWDGNDVSIILDESKTTYNEDDYMTEMKNSVDMGKTFAITGTGENAPKITVAFDGESVGDPYDGVYHYNANSKNANVTFSKMSTPSIVFEDSNLNGNQNRFDLQYNPTKHCYEFNTAISWEFSAGEQQYKIKLKNDLPFGSFEYGDYSGIFGEVDDTEYNFVVYGKAPEVSIDLSPDTYYKKHDNDYYNTPLTATITVKDPFLPKLANFKPTVKLDNEDISESCVWTAIDGGYKATIECVNDKAYDFSIEAKNNVLISENINKKFIIDTVAPAFKISYSGYTNSVVNEDGSIFYYGLTDGKTRDAGYVSDIVAEICIEEGNFYKDDIVVTVEKKDDSSFALPEDCIDFSETGSNPNAPKKQNIIKVTIPSYLEEDFNDGEFDIRVTYTDPAEHKMVLKPDFEPEPEYTVIDGEYVSTERRDIIDTIQPVATFHIDKCENGHYDNDADYYNFAFSAWFDITEVNYADKVGEDKYVEAKVLSTNGDEEMSLESESKKYSFKVPDDAKDGDYQFCIIGKDLANNVITVCVKKDNGATSNDPGLEDAGGYMFGLNDADTPYISGRKVLDRTNPTVKLDVLTEADKQDIPSGYNRFFFNQDFTATFTIDETNFDSERVGSFYGVNNAATDYATDDVGELTNELKITEGTKQFEFKDGEEDGLYALKIFGEDKAGNPIVIDPSDSATHKFVEKATEKELVSHVIVVDHVAPELSVTMNDTSKDIYKAELKKDNGEDKYVVSLNKPYQKKTSAVVRFAENDKSPANYSYSIISTVEGQSKAETNKVHEKNFTRSVTMEGAQTYYIESISVEDLAGNKISMSNSNKIYLDTTPPNHDNLQPTISFVAKASGAGRGPEGNPLFSTDVDVVVNITDPDAKKSSTGLYQVYYQVLVNDGDVTSTITPASSTGSASTGIINYGTSGPTYSEDGKVIDENLVYADKLTFHFTKENFNNNNIKVYVWAIDNAGNEIAKSQAAYYAFGIDNTAPSISVSYDNNSAQNGKYFKANRTATVTVTERNFDAGRTSISTEAGAHIGGWSYQRGNSANGDDDRWIANVVYDTDGDYTFGVSATDLVGHGASGVSYGDSVAPTAFTIDKTIPTIIVSFDNNNVQNGRYYNANRRATVDITEHNFDAKDANVERKASIAEGTVATPNVGNWNRINDLNRTEVYFGQDGDYTMKVDYVDLAGNPAETYIVDLFTIDTVAPTLEINGVENKHAYNGNVAPSISYHDINYDKNSAEVKITGYKHTSGANLNGTRTDEAFGGSFTCDNIEVRKENDDVYTAVGRVKDLAGNETSDEVTFSVNRFGSTYILNDETEDLVDQYYSNTEHTLGITEINVNEISNNEVTYSLNGEVVTLSKGNDYSVKGDNPGWWQYDYTIDASNFEKEGSYIVTLSSEDEATNVNTTRAIKENGGATSELEIEFMIDKTAPSLIITGVEDNGRYSETQRTIVVRYEDNSFVSSLNLYANGQLVQQLDSKALSEAGGQIEYVATSKSVRQNIRVEAVDAAGNQDEAQIERFLITRNFLVQFVNNTPLLIAVIAGLLLAAGGIFFIILLRRRKKEQY